MKADKEFIKEKVYSAITASYTYRELAPHDITYETDISTEYDIPSVSIVTLIAELEEEDSVELSFSDMHRLHTINEIADFIESSDIAGKICSPSASSPTKSVDELFNDI